MFKKSAAALSLSLFAFFMPEGKLSAQGAQAPKFQDGIHYRTIENAPATTSAKVKVVEAFSYMCNHCADFEPYVNNWKERQAGNVEFIRFPVVFGRGSWELYARAYVTAEIMGIADKAHGPLMDKLWKEKSILKSMEELAGFYAGFGTVPGDFLATSKSFAVDAKLRKQQRDLQTADIRGTPSLIIADKYVVAAGEAVGSFQVMLEVTDFLIAQELSAHAAASKAAGAATPVQNATVSEPVSVEN